MSEGQAMVLWLMFIIGIFSVPVLCSSYWRIGSDMVLYRGYDYSKKWRIAAAIWLVFWCFPPLAILWIKGVFG